MAQQTLVVGLAHPDDEVGVAGTICAQRARGDRVVIVWLTRGEMTDALGDLPREEVAYRRQAQGEQAAAILGVEARFLDYPDTRLRADLETTGQVARLLAELQPDGVLTWGEAWVRGMRHPDHQASGRIFRDAITLARIRKAVAPTPPHRAMAPVWTLRDLHSALPVTAVDVEPHLDTIREIARFYHQGIGFGDPDWMMRRLMDAGRAFGIRYAELFDAWETEPGVVSSLLPAVAAGMPHPNERPTNHEARSG